MRKTMISILIFAIVLIGFFVFIKVNPPLETGTISIGTSENKQILILEIGNKGFGDIKIKRVVVNDNEELVDAKIQVSNPLKGFIVSENFDGKAKEYGMTDIKDVKLLPHTSPSENLETVNNGTATENDKSYGLTVMNRNPIYEVKIYYTYLGFSFEKRIPIAKN
ncbi:hypothetical protein AA0X95_03830 [Bacillus sp. 1P10SD]|uniref:hypothetical protein n=1 Tax=Bacillus sp. 1P10SD TaxID=3132265 RepID=UPI0039A46DCA